MSRKVSVESVGDDWTDDLLRNLYVLAFRQDGVRGWLTAIGFIAIPVWISIVCMTDGNIAGAAVFGTIAVGILGIRLFLLRMPNRETTMAATPSNGEAD